MRTGQRASLWTGEGSGFIAIRRMVPVSAPFSSALKADLAVFLIPARTDTRWFHDIVLPAAGNPLCSWAAEVRRGKNSAPFPSMVVIFGGKP